MRPTAFKPVLPRSGAILHSSPESTGHQLHPVPLDKPKEQELKPSLCSGALSDSGRNSMSSLPTHSTSSSYQLDPLVTPVGPASRFGGSAHNITQGIVLQDSNMMSLKALSFSDGGSKLAHASKDKGSVRSPTSTDQRTIQELEEQLLGREGERRRLHRSFEEKELAASQPHEGRPRRGKDELEGLEAKGKLKVATQKSQRAQQVLHLQVLQLQQEKRQLRQELESLMKEQDLLETKLRSYEKEKTSFAPALEETQWEVRMRAWAGGWAGVQCLHSPPLSPGLFQALGTREKCEVAQSCPTLCNPMDCSPPGFSVRGDSPGKNTGAGCHALLQGIFTTQGSNPGLLHCRQILYHLSHQGNPRILDWIAYPFSRESSQPRN